MIILDRNGTLLQYAPSSHTHNDTPGEQPKWPQYETPLDRAIDLLLGTVALWHYTHPQRDPAPLLVAPTL